MNMDGRTVLVTGSTDGVGRYVAAKLASAGAKVLIHGREGGRGKALADEIRREGRGEAVFYQADLSSLAAVRQLADAVLADTGRLELTPQSPGLLALSLGLSANFTDDHAMLEHGIVMYDAFYAWCRSCQEQTHNWTPGVRTP
jgi:NAD(P)-dependent dehydrogenase (short-subunit alcohol dehydrogenase family)